MYKNPSNNYTFKMQDNSKTFNNVKNPNNVTAPYSNLKQFNETFLI